MGKIRKIPFLLGCLLFGGVVGFLSYDLVAAYKYTQTYNNARIAFAADHGPVPYATFDANEFIPYVDPTPEPTPKPTKKPKPKPVAKPDVTWPSGAYRPWRYFNANVTRARVYALARLERVQFNCIDRLFTRESGWRVHAENKSSGAYGIPQSLPGRKMAKFGDDWRDNATTQVKWGIWYVNNRYGSACRALQHSYNTGWY